MKTKLKYKLIALFNPRYWFSAFEISKEWDKELNELIDEYVFESVDDWTAKIGNRKVWIKTDHFFDQEYGIKLPKPSTRARAMEKYRREIGGTK